MHACMQNPQNVNLVVDIAVEYTDAMGGWDKVLDVMEKAPSASQMEFAYLARRIATSEEPEEHYRYIVAAAKCQQFQVRTPCIYIQLDRCATVLLLQPRRVQRCNSPSTEQSPTVFVWLLDRKAQASCPGCTLLQPAR